MGDYAAIIKKCEKEWSCPELMDSVNRAGGRKIPFSSPSLNWATYGGVPRAAMSEFYGVPGGGKTTSAVDLCKNAVEIFNKEFSEEVIKLQEELAKGKKESKIKLQDLNERGPKKVLYLDLEHSFNITWAGVLGITHLAIDIMQPPDVAAEQILQKVQDIICTGEVGLIILDSIPSLVSQKELDKKYGEASVAPIAGLMTMFCRKVTQLLTRYDCTFIFINQLRASIVNPYADQTPGGEAIKFYCSLRLKFLLGSPLDFLGNEIPQKSENPAGYKVTVKIVKQKSAPFDRKLGEYYLMTQTGIRIDYEFAKLAITKYEIIKKNGGWYYFYDPETGEPYEKDGDIVKVNGLAKVYDYLNIDLEYDEKMRNHIINDINANGLEIESTAEDNITDDV